MHFSEDDLKAALQREDPGLDFTDRVMAEIGRDRQRILARPTRSKFAWWPFTFAPALAGALAIIVLMAGAWLGYQRYQRNQELGRAEKARQEAILALQITNAKLNHIFRRVNQQEQQQPKIRRQSL